MLNNRLGVVILGIALALSLRDIYGHSEDEHDLDDEAAAFTKEFGDEVISNDEVEGEEIPVRTPSSHFTAPHTLKNLPPMKFLFWLVVILIIDILHVLNSSDERIELHSHRNGENSS